MHCWCSSRLAGRDPPRLDSSTSGTGGGGAESVPERADRRLLCVPVPAGPGVPSDMPGAALVGPAAGPLRARGAALASWPTAITLLRSELEMQMRPGPRRTLGVCRRGTASSRMCPDPGVDCCPFVDRHPKQRRNGRSDSLKARCACKHQLHICAACPPGPSRTAAQRCRGCPFG